MHLTNSVLQTAFCTQLQELESDKELFILFKVRPPNDEQDTQVTGKFM
jgi:hypothetical protein